MAVNAKKVAVFGGGTFAVAVGTLFARNGHNVVLLARDKDVVQSINNDHINCRYLSEYKLHPNISATDDVKTALDGADFILHAVPVQASPKFFETIKDLVPSSAPIVSLSKGIHIETLRFMCDIFNDIFGPNHPTAYFSGPSFARELMDEQPTAVVVASNDEKLAATLQQMLSSNRIRVYTSTDVKGVEVGGALKNMYAIAAGVCEGMGFKLNTAAALVTRGCSEIRKLAHAMDADHSTLNGLSGIGDLMLTCFGPASRNRSVGVRLGKGEKIEDILASMSEVAEGVATTEAAAILADKYGVDMPLARAVHAILHGADCAQEVDKLMHLPLRPED